MAFQLGLDTGGTYTDAVIVDDDHQVLAHAKSLTTHGDLIKGLYGAVDNVLTQLADQYPQVAPPELNAELNAEVNSELNPEVNPELNPELNPEVNLVCLSTTLATNALVEGRGRPVCLILIGSDESELRRADLLAALGSDPVGFVAGGHTAGGEAVVALDEAALTELILSVNDRVDAFAVSGLFAVRNPAHELAAQATISRLTGKPVSCGHHLSSGLDAPRRALTALLNARLIPMIGSLLEATHTMLKERCISAPLMVVKGDGSLIAAQVAADYPVETILSGPAASVVGARFLCGQDDLLVSDMGGTTTDIALIRDGRPQLSAQGATVGGWRTMVNAIDVRTFGLGGDSHVRFDREQRNFVLGPQRVMSLSLLIHEYPELLAELDAQLALPRSTTHSAEFVMAHAVRPESLSAQQLELYERVREKPVALQTLFAEQTLERALMRLEQRGVVLRAAFTPTDASHVTGHQSNWNAQAARIAARLLMRYSANNLGREFQDESDFANHIRETAASGTAVAIVESVFAAESASNSNKPNANKRPGRVAVASGLHASQRRLFEHGFANQTGSAMLTLAARLNMPIVGLGAPAASYYSRTAELLSTQAVLPRYAGVANALGAVVGTVHQQQVITITPAGGGKRVNVLFPDGPQVYDSLEDGAAAAEMAARELATGKAKAAGATMLDITVDRYDNIVEDGSDTVFFESRITVSVVGRPTTAQQ